MTRLYYRPLVQTGRNRPAEAVALAGGWGWFTQVEILRRNGVSDWVRADALPAEILTRLTAPRAPIAGLDMSTPRLMGILNVTPDSFSDGGQFADQGPAIAQGQAMVGVGADLVDIGGESTRPGADLVPAEDESARILPVIRGLAGMVPISVDTRKASVGQAALDAGATLLNDVSAMSFDADMAPLAARTGAPICLMHAQGDPKTMQAAPEYDDVLLDVYDYLETRIDAATSAGISPDRIIADPGIGFGKTLDHNLRLIQNLSLFHGLGVPILLGASRKRFIGTIGNAPEASERMPGSVAVALAGIAQGVQITRVHDIAATKQAMALWQAVTG